jgi:hypothetical protein
MKNEHPKIFLTAEWNNLIMLNYAAPHSLLEKFVPPGTELDAFNGTSYISLVAFEFNKTRLYGIPIPFHQSFEELNLRFYVKRVDKRGVVFIRELVPKRAVAAMARLIYGERYSYAPISHQVTFHDKDNGIEAQYNWSWQNQKYSLRLTTNELESLPPEGSIQQYITEHYWGYALQPNSTSLEYEVQHPQWPIRSARSAAFIGDATALYGEEFAQILSGTPDSAYFIDGSPVTIFKKRSLN